MRKCSQASVTYYTTIILGKRATQHKRSSATASGMRGALGHRPNCDQRAEKLQQVVDSINWCLNHLPVNTCIHFLVH